MCIRDRKKHFACKLLISFSWFSVTCVAFDRLFFFAFKLLEMVLVVVVEVEDDAFAPFINFC